jgi:hypothetical protein
MHPDMMLGLMQQRERELQDRARESRRARTARQTARCQRDRGQRDRGQRNLVLRDRSGASRAFATVRAAVAGHPR